jgi:hypothetical protein
MRRILSSCSKVSSWPSKCEDDRVITTTTGARNLRLAAAGLIAVAVVWPALPAHGSLCPLRASTGIPCPLCGLTRACVAAVHGHLGTSLAYHPLGIAVVIAAAVFLLRPTVLTRLRPPPTAVLIAGLGVLWLWNLGFNPTFHQWLLPG